MKVLFVLLCLAASLAQADEGVSVCYNYGCLNHADVVYSDARLRVLGMMLGRSDNAEEERQAIGEAIGLMLGWAGEQSPISADRGGNVADGGVNGRMDCIDHSTTTTRLLKLIESHGWLHYHKVLDVVQRKRFFLFDHFAAQIGEVDDNVKEAVGKDDDAKRFRARYAVDSWFFDNGRPAVVMPLERWSAGESPDVSE